jgi:hypothetical protein
MRAPVLWRWHSSAQNNENPAEFAELRRVDFCRKKMREAREGRQNELESFGYYAEKWEV